MTDTPVPYTLAHVWCCDCDDCLNGPIPYKLTGAGKTYRIDGLMGDVPREIEAAKARLRSQRDKARRAG